MFATFSASVHLLLKFPVALSSAKLLLALSKRRDPVRPVDEMVLLRGAATLKTMLFMMPMRQTVKKLALFMMMSFEEMLVDLIF